MQKWEYLYLVAYVGKNNVSVFDISVRTILDHVEPAEFQNYLNRLGSEGWEMVSCAVEAHSTIQKFYFKRPVE